MVNKELIVELVQAVGPSLISVISIVVAVLKQHKNIVKDVTENNKTIVKIVDDKTSNINTTNKELRITNDALNLVLKELIEVKIELAELKKEKVKAISYAEAKSIYKEDKKKTTNFKNN